MAKTRDMIIQNATDSFISGLSYSMAKIYDKAWCVQTVEDLIQKINFEIKTENATRAQQHDTRMQMVENLPNYSIAEMILHTGDIKIVTGLFNFKRICMNWYDDNGDFTGIMQVLDFKAEVGEPEYPGRLYAMIRRLRPNMSEGDLANIKSQIKTALYERSGYTIGQNRDNHLIPCYNGIWNYDTREFTAYTDPDYMSKYGGVAFLNKLDTPWVENAPSPSFVQPDGTTWTVDKFFEDLFDMNTDIGKASSKMLWEIAQFILRGYSGKSGSIILFENASERSAGQNGKSTWAAMMQCLIDHMSVDSYVTNHGGSSQFVANGQRVLPCNINEWSKDFMLSYEIRNAMFLVSDETTEDTQRVDGSGTIKGLARRLSKTYNIKHGRPFYYIFPGVILHMQNELLKMKSTSDSMFTHQHELRFEKDFSEEAGGNPDVLDRYVVDDGVLEYVLWHVTQMECLADYSKDLTDALKPNIAERKAANVPVFQFLDDVLLGFNMPRIPAKWLYEMYTSVWQKREGIKYELQFSQFKKDMAQYVRNHSKWFEWVPKAFYFNDQERFDMTHCKELGDAIEQYSIVDATRALSFVERDNVFNSTIVRGFKANELTKQYLGYVQVTVDGMIEMGRRKAENLALLQAELGVDPNEKVPAYQRYNNDTMGIPHDAATA